MREFLIILAVLSSLLGGVLLIVATIVGLFNPASSVAYSLVLGLTLIACGALLSKTVARRYG